MLKRRPSVLVSAALVLGLLGAIGCGDAAGAGGAGAGTGGDAASTSASTGASTATSSGSASGSTGSGGSPSCEGFPVAPMPLLSRGAPAYASSGGDPSQSNDDNPASEWSSSSVPAWIAYDLSGAPASQRQKVLVAWYAIHSGCYVSDSPGPGEARPVSYELEVNTAPGGAAPPDGGWTSVASFTGDNHCARHHLVDMGGANWIRIRVTESTDPSAVGFDFDVHAAAECPSDAWLFMGDSITYMTMTYAFSDLPDLVHQAVPSHDPAVLDAAIGGTNTGTALDTIDENLAEFPGRFVVLAYGTNDHANDFHMEELVQKVVAAGKTPVVPHMPWSSGSMEGMAINAQIDALYAKYPEIVPGPDLWSVFFERTDLIPVGDVHPNAAGQEELRKAWAATMAKLD